MTIQQSGTITAGHVVVWVAPGIIGDGGTSSNGAINTFGFMANSVSSFGISNADPAGAHNRMTFGVSGATAEIGINAFNGALPIPLRFNLHGTYFDLVNSTTLKATNAAIKIPVRGATTTNITLSGEQTVDGLALVAGDRELVKNQTDASENGILIVSATAWTRANDFAADSDITQGTLISVQNGTTNADSVFRITSADTMVIGTSDITFGLYTIIDATVVANLAIVAPISADIITVAGISTDVTTVSTISADVTTVVGNSANITTVAGISANVTTVAGISADVTTVAADGTDIGVVAGDTLDINILSPISADITTVAGISANVTTVAGISADVTQAATDTIPINTAAGDTVPINTVAGISANVTTVAGIAANVTTVAGISADVATVAGISGDVTAVAAQSFKFLFDTTTTMADPGSGDIRYNNATPSSVTQIAVSNTFSGGSNISPFIVTWDDSSNATLRGTLTIQDSASATTFQIFSITGAVTDNGAWLQLAVTHVSGATLPGNGDALFLGFVRSGDDGAGSLSNVVEDTTPQLGGFLDPNGNYIGRAKGGDIVAASPLIIDVDGDYFVVTGNTSFAGMVVAADRNFALQFTGTPTITVGSGITLNNAGSNYTVEAADIIECQSTATNTVTGRIIKADGTAVVSLSAEKIQDIAGPLVASGGTKTGITITYQDGSNDMDFVVDNATPMAVGSLYGSTDINSTPWRTLLGFNAGLNLTGTGTANTLIGINAGKLATSLSSSVAVGYNALGTGIATGEFIVCVGRSSGEDIESATGMTFVGRSAGQFQISGNNCSSFGLEAESSTTSVSNEFTLGNSSVAVLRCQQTSITALSDEKDKRNIQSLDDSLDFINALRPVTFQFDVRDWYYNEEIIVTPGKVIPEQTIKGKTITVLIDGVETQIIEPDTIIPEYQKPDDEKTIRTPKPRDGSKTLSDIETGFIAQEVQVAIATHGRGKLNRLIHDLNPDKLEFTQGDLLVPAIKAIQELSAKNDALEARLTAGGL